MMSASYTAPTVAHKLLPIEDGKFLSPEEVVRRLRAEFDYVEADADAGTDHVLSMIDGFKRFPDAGHLIEEYKPMIGQAIHIVVSDREDFERTSSISFTAMPNRGLFIGYTGRSHEANAAPLIERACRALKYQAKLV